MFSRSIPILVAVLFLSPSAQIATRGQSGASVRSSLMAEFPTSDLLIAEQEQSAARAKERFDFTGAAGETVQAVEFLLAHRRVAEALDLASIVAD